MEKRELDRLVQLWSETGDPSILHDIAPFVVGHMMTGTFFRGTVLKACYYPDNIVRYDRPRSWTDDYHTAKMFALMNSENLGGIPCVLVIDGEGPMFPVSDNSSVSTESEFLSDDAAVFVSRYMESGEDGMTMVTLEPILS